MNWFKKVYANRTVDRGFWTFVELTIGAIVTYMVDHFASGGIFNFTAVQVGTFAGAVVFAIKEYAAKQLAKDGGPIAVPAPAPVTVTPPPVEPPAPPAA